MSRKKVIMRNKKPLEVEYSVYIWKKRRRERIRNMTAKRKLVEQLVSLLGPEETSRYLNARNKQYHTTPKSMLQNNNFKAIRRFIAQLQLISLAGSDAA